MSPAFAIELISNALMAAFWLAAPLLMVGFFVSGAINILQILTSLQDSVISTVPRLAAFLFLFVALMPWMVNQLIAYTHALLADFTRYVG